MGSLDTRLHDLEGKVRALVTSYLHHGRRLSEQQDEIDGMADGIAALEARVAALEGYINLLYRAQAAAPKQAAQPAPQQPRSQIEQLMHLMGMVPKEYWKRLGDEWLAACKQQPRGGGG